VLVITDPLHFERQIAARLAAKLAALPSVIIEDETVLLKNGQILMLGQSEGVGHSLHADLFPCQQVHVVQLLKDLEKDKGLDIS
jgi:hypothetical protein